jgi:hypothetical protein
LPFSNNGVISGKLSFAGNLAFNNGGIYYWTLQDTSRSDGISQIDVAGNLSLGGLTAGGFTIEAVTYDANGNKGNAASNLNIFAPTSWTILTAASISSFSAADFIIDPTKFDIGNGITASNFFLTQSGNQLVLNFTPVPEPSTWALLGIGVAGVGLLAIRRRRVAIAV